MEPSEPVLVSSAHTRIYLEFPFITNLLIRRVHCTRTLSKHSSSGGSPRHDPHSRRVCGPSELVSTLRALGPASACTREGGFRHLRRSHSTGPAGSPGALPAPGMALGGGEPVCCRPRSREPWLTLGHGGLQQCSGLDVATCPRNATLWSELRLPNIFHLNGDTHNNPALFLRKGARLGDACVSLTPILPLLG